MIGITLGFNLGETPKIQREHKGKSILSFPCDYTVIDLETTGLSPVYDSIIEFGAIRVRGGEVVETFSSLVNSKGVYVDSYITELTGISQEMVDSAPSMADILPCFLNFVGSDILVGHNINFDINFVYDETIQQTHSYFSNDFIDTMRISRRLFRNERHHRLSDLCKRYNLDYSSAHRALDDCQLTYDCFNRLKSNVIIEYGSEDEFKKQMSIVGRSVRSSDITGNSEKLSPFHPLYEKVCVITGVLEKMTRRNAMQIIADIGGINADSVTRKTNYLILGNNAYCQSIKDGKSSKQKKAEKLRSEGYDIEIIPESIFYDLIFEH